MKRFNLTLISVLFGSVLLFAQNSELSTVKDNVSKLERIVKNIQKSNEQLERKNKEFKANIFKQQNEISSLKQNVLKNTENIKITANETGTKITEANASIVANKTTIEQNLYTKTIFGGLVILLTLIFLVVIYSLLRKRINISTSAIDKINDIQKILQEESLKLDGKLVEILETQIIHLY